MNIPVKKVHDCNQTFEPCDGRPFDKNGFKAVTRVEPIKGSNVLRKLNGLLIKS
jgi:hypothetical protein